MAKPRMDLSGFVGKLLEEQDGDVLREGVRVLAQALMEAEVTTLVGAERHERSEERTAYRNGTRVRSWDTRVGSSPSSPTRKRKGGSKKEARKTRAAGQTWRRERDSCPERREPRSA